MAPKAGRHPAGSEALSQGLQPPKTRAVPGGAAAAAGWGRHRRSRWRRSSSPAIQNHGNKNIAVTHAYIPQIMDQASTQFAIES